MKKSTLTLAILFSGLLATSQLLNSCGSKKENTEESAATADSTRQDEMKMDSTALAYECPMHPDVTGKVGDTCSKCGMELAARKSTDSTKHEH